MAEIMTDHGLIVGLIEDQPVETKLPEQDEAPVQEVVSDTPRRGRKPKNAV